MATASSSTAHLNSGRSVRHRHEPAPSTSSGPANPQAGYNEPDVPVDHGRRKRRSKGKGRALPWYIGQKGWVKEGFRRFGEHCARNQIRTLLIDCLVMTNLFYPSLALYLQKKFPPLHPPSPPSHNTHRIALQRQTSGRARRVQKEHPLSLLSTPVLDSFFPYPPPLLPRLSWAGWWGRDTGQSNGELEGREQEWSATRIRVNWDAEEGLGESKEEIRIARIGWADVGHVLDRDIEGEGGRKWEERDDILLRLVRDMAEEWEKENQHLGERCVRELGAVSDVGTEVKPVGPCYVLSPNYHNEFDDISVTSLSNLARSAASPSSANHTELSSSTPIGWAPNAGNVYHSAAVLFRVPRKNSGSFEMRWSESMENLARKIEGEVFVEAQGIKGGIGDQTGEWLLTHTSTSSLPDATVQSSPAPVKAGETISSSPPKLVLLLYVLLVGILLAQLSNATKVHSRYGLAFTGVVQLICSAIMSFSVVALLGWNGWGSSQDETVLPTYVLPFVIVVVGVENMSTLTKAVFSVPFAYSVPVRIGIGLSRVGTTIALTSLTDVIVLGIVWLFVNLRPVREFCVFACVVIITDWFMLHTFFLTVLSIDAQRLELADVLAPPSSGKSATVPVVSQSEEEASQSSQFHWRSMLRARTAKSGSLILLLLSVGILYYFTESGRPANLTTAGLYGYTPASTTSSVMAAATATPTAFLTTVNDLMQLSTPERFWRALNPHGWPFVRVVIPAASIIVLPRKGHQMLPKDIRKLAVPSSRLLLPRLKPLFYLFKVVVLPQAVTASALYLVLLYLLKDSDLLDAQRNRQGRSDKRHSEELDTTTGLQPPSTAKSSAGIASTVQAHMLPCSHESDIDLISTSLDGKLVLSVGIDNAVFLWRFHDGQASTGTREPVNITGLAIDDPITAAAISSDARWIAVVSAGGVLIFWEVSDEGDLVLQPIRRLNIGENNIKVTDVVFDLPDAGSQDLFKSDSPRSDKIAAGPTVIIACSSGAVYSSLPSGEAVEVIPPQKATTRCRTHFGVSMEDSRDISIVVGGPDGSVFWKRSGNSWTSTLLETQPSTDQITAISQSNPSGLNVQQRIIALGYRSGLIELFDDSGSLITVISRKPPSSSLDPVRKIEIACPESTKCIGCGTISSEGYFVISSTKSCVYVDRVQPRSNVFCKCPLTNSKGGSADDQSFKSPSPSRRSLTRTNSQNLVIPPSPGRALSPRSSPRKSPSLLAPQSNGEFPLSSHGIKKYGDRQKDDGDGGIGLSFSNGNGHANGMINGTGSHARSNSADKSNGTTGLSLTLTAPGPNGLHSSSIAPSGVDLEVISLGAVICQSGGWYHLPLGGSSSGGVILGVRRVGMGVDDSQWQIWSLDLSAAWNGTTLIVDSTSLNSLLFQTRNQTSKSQSTSTNPLSIHPTTSESNTNERNGISMKSRRAERLLSLNGRAPFPSTLGSFTIPTHPGLAYISIHPIQSRGSRSIVAGFGNRLGVLSIPILLPGIGIKENGSSGLMKSIKKSSFTITPPPPQGARRVGNEVQ